MIRFFRKFKWVAFAAVVSVFAGCSTNPDDPTQVIVDPVDPVVLQEATSAYFGYGEAPSCDHYTLALGEGDPSVFLDIYAPMRTEPGLPAGRYEVRKPMQMGKLYTVEPELSYFNLAGGMVGIVSGAIDVAVAGDRYTIKGEVAGADGKVFTFRFDGLLNNPGYSVSKVDGYYYDNALDSACDSYSLLLMTPGVSKNELSLTGAGQALCLTLYAPLGSGDNPQEGTYGPYTADVGETRAFKFQAGKGNGQLGELSGSYVYVCSSPGVEAKRVYLDGGQVVVQKSGGDYSIRAVVTGEDQVIYEFDYQGTVNPLERKTDFLQAVPLSKSGGLYLGTMMAEGFDNFSFYMFTEGVDDTNMSFSGVGTGVYFDLYVPVAGTTRLPAGTYTLSAAPANFTFLPGADMGGMTSGSFVYLMNEGDADKQYIPIVGGSFTVSKDKRIYTVAVDVVCSNDKRYKFTYTGTTENILDPADAVTYQEMVKAEAYYFRDMFDPAYDNWTFALTGNGVALTPSLAFEGTGTGVCFDLFTPPAASPVFPASTYLPYGGSGSKEYKYIPGEDYGEGMLQGSYVWIKNEGDAKPTYVYVVNGPVTVEKTGDSHTIKAKLFGDDGKEYNLKYTGVLTVYDPFADM